jgi:hypothetical protein
LYDSIYNTELSFFFFQPLDLTFFSSLKKEMKKLVWSWQSSPCNTGNFLNKYSVIGLLYKATENCLTKPDLISNGFKRAGIVPWDKMAPDLSKLLPSTVFENPVLVPGSNTSQPAKGDSSVLEYSTLSTSSEQNQDEPMLSNSPNLPTLFASSTSSLPASDASVSRISDNSCVIVSTDGPTISEADITNTANNSELALNMAFIEDPSAPEDDYDDSSSLPYWTGDTEKCGHCQRRIMKKFYSIHLSNCTPPTPVSPSTSSTPLDVSSVNNSSSTPTSSSAISQNVQNQPGSDSFKSIPDISLAERKNHLLKFEVLLLNPEQVEEFNLKFSTGLVGSAEPLYQAWFQLKLSTQPTESEAVLQVLSSHTASNVPKRQRKRNVVVPDGPSRYDPSSPQWVQILEERENKNASPPKKAKPTKSKNQPKPTAASKPKGKSKKPTKENIRV